MLNCGNCYLNRLLNFGYVNCHNGEFLKLSVSYYYRHLVSVRRDLGFADEILQRWILFVN